MLGCATETEASCAADINGDGTVNAFALGLLLGAFDVLTARVS